MPLREGRELSSRVRLIRLFGPCEQSLVNHDNRQEGDTIRDIEHDLKGLDGTRGERDGVGPTLLPDLGRERAGGTQALGLIALASIERFVGPENTIDPVNPSLGLSPYASSCWKRAS